MLTTHIVVSCEVDAGSVQSSVASTKVSPAPSCVRLASSDSNEPVISHSISLAW